MAPSGTEYLSIITGTRRNLGRAGDAGTAGAGARVSAPLLEQQLERVEETTVDADFVMQMWTSRPAG